MKGDIHPLQNQVLIRLLPPETFTHGGLILPDIAMFNAHGEKVRPRKGLVMAIGKWRQTKQGYYILPDFHVGQRVLVSEYFGTKLTRGFSEHLRLCRIDDVLAVLEEEITAPPSHPSIDSHAPKAAEGSSSEKLAVAGRDR